MQQVYVLLIVPQNHNYVPSMKYDDPRGACLGTHYLITYELHMSAPHEEYIFNQLGWSNY